MKRTLLTLSLLFFSLALSLPARAETQTDDCGRNMTQLSSVIRNKFFGTFSQDFVRHFVGTWQSGMTSFDITPSQSFTIKGQQYAICPQIDRTFYVYQVADPSQNGTLRVTSSKISVSNGKGILSWANGEYVRVPAVELATRQ